MRPGASRGLVVVRGAGDLATGVILRLARSGYQVVALETAQPTAIRRTVAFSEAVYEGEAKVEGLEARLAKSPGEAQALCGEGYIAILVDPGCLSLETLRPLALVDAILAKRNLGTRSSLAPIVVALGPGFEAPGDAHAVVETMRGHTLGRVIRLGGAEPDTGTPGLIGGEGAKRVVHAGSGGVTEGLRSIGDAVREGDPILAIRSEDGLEPVVMSSPLDGILRGLIRSGIHVRAGLKVADVDPRGRREHCYSASDKALAVAGGVLEALLTLEHERMPSPEPARAQEDMR